jgi:hypothetical protein
MALRVISHQYQDVQAALLRIKKSLNRAEDSVCDIAYNFRMQSCYIMMYYLSSSKLLSSEYK